MKKIRRLQAKTDYKARRIMLKSDKPRIVVRKTNKYIIGQLVKSKQAQDFVITGVTSQELTNYGIDKKSNGSLKSIAASYLTGFLLGKKIQDKEDKAEGILDIGLMRNVKGSRIFSFLKGVIDSGVEISADEKSFPEASRIAGKHMKNSLEVDKIKLEIAKKFK